MKRLLVVTFTALLLVGLHAMPAQAAKRDTPDIPIPVTSKTCEITQHTNAIVAIDPLANDYLVGGFGEIRSNSDFDINVNDCLVCLPYTKQICETCERTVSWQSCDANGNNCETQTERIKWTCCRTVRLCHYVTMACSD